MRFASKDEFRHHCKRVLFKNYHNKAVVQRLKRLIDIVKPKNVLLFYPLKHEPDIRTLFIGKKEGQSLYLPFMQGQSFEVVKFRLPLQRKRFGIYEPKFSKTKRKIDLVVVPVIGVDGDFRRIGFGKGMYDRFFAALDYRPVVVFVQNQTCFTKQILSDPYDVKGDLLITPKEIIIRGDSDVGRDIGRKLCSYSKWRCRVYVSKENRKRSSRSL